MITKNKTNRRALLICGHGSRSIEYKNDLLLFKRKIKEKLEFINIYHCFIEINEPLIDNSIKELIQKYDEVFIFPLLIFEGKHMIKDVKEKVKSISLNNNKKLYLLDKISLINEILPEMPNVIKPKFRSNQFDLLITSCSKSKKQNVSEELKLYTQKLSNILNIKKNIFYSSGNEKDVLREIHKLKITFNKVLLHPIFLFNGFLYMKSINNISKNNKIKNLKPLTHYDAIVDILTKKLIRSFQTFN